MTTGAALLLVTVAAVLCLGGWRATTDGRFRSNAPRDVQQDASQPGDGADTPEPTVADALVGAGVATALGERATLVQFSSAFCAPCRATRRVLADVAAAVPGVAHVEVDAEAHLQLVRDLGVVRTPTTVVLDAVGREITRAAGAPRKEQVLSALPADGDPT
ncbi:thioredoxin family protein [Nocardioides sp. SYSU DS0663]|uniref:thioredoxin family protein n=1 Tax=Nocardioides sp. SYSU DS0663 TaxID=3416445 RepID=UPI003F4C578A